MRLRCGLGYFLNRYPEFWNSNEEYKGLRSSSSSETTNSKFLVSSSSSDKLNKIEISIESSMVAIIEGAEMMPKNNTVKKIDTAFLNITFVLWNANIKFNQYESVKYF